LSRIKTLNGETVRGISPVGEEKIAWLTSSHMLMSAVKVK